MTSEAPTPVNFKGALSEAEDAGLHKTRYPLTLVALALRARAAIVLVGLTALLGLGLGKGDGIRPPDRPEIRQNDAALHVRTIGRLRDANSYYEVVGLELRRAGYPTRSVFNWRTPAHYELIAWLTIERATIIFRLLIVAAVVGTIWGVAAESPRRSIAAGLLTMGGMLMPLMISSVEFGEVCAGVLIGLSLAVYCQRRWFTLAALLGIAAVFLREIAAPYAITCGVLAITHRRRAESMAWVIGGVGYLIYYAVHATNVIQHSQPTDVAHAESWLQFRGLSFVLQTLHSSGWLVLMPMWVTPVACVMALAATWAPSIPQNVKWCLLVYFAFFSAVGHPFNFYWGWVSISIWCCALIYSGEGIRQLLKEAFCRKQSLSDIRIPGASGSRTDADGPRWTPTTGN